MLSSPLPTPLHALAARGHEALLARYDALCQASQPAKRLGEALWDRGRVSINMKLEALEALAVDGQRMTLLEFVASRSPAGNLDADLRRHLGRWYHRRMLLETTLGGEHRFHYGALHLGGAGLERYGPYCVVLRLGPGSGHSDPVWAEDDSLRGPWWTTPLNAESPCLDQERLAQGLSAPAGGHALAGLKHGPTLPDGESRWGELLGSDDGYIEALMVDRPLLSHVERIWISAGETQRLESIALNQASGVMDPLEAHILQRHEAMLAGLERRGIPCAAVED